MLILAIPIASSLTSDHFSLSFIRTPFDLNFIERNACSLRIHHLQGWVHDVIRKDGYHYFKVRTDKSSLVSYESACSWISGTESDFLTSGTVVFSTTILSMWMETPSTAFSSWTSPSRVTSTRCRLFPSQTFYFTRGTFRVGVIPQFHT